MLRRGQLGLVQQCLPTMANKRSSRSCVTSGVVISRMGSTLRRAKPIVTWTISSQSQTRKSSLAQSGLMLPPARCHAGLQRKDLPSSKTSGRIFLDDDPTIEELEGQEVFDTIRSQVTICCGMNAAAPPPPSPPGGRPMTAAAAGAGGASGGGGGGGAAAGAVTNANTHEPKTLRHAQTIRGKFSRVSSHAVVALIRCDKPHQRGGVGRVLDAAADQG